ncbi:response regulator [Lentibacillus sp. N15]|uniref:response regulator n=1 Tax=Lentibacillus songyuanensis TaxID=3136161 RepID=UPI0031BAF985
MAKILVVDDAKFMRVTLGAILEKDNHVIAGEAQNGREAIDQYKELKPDIVTMDITMPVMNGIDAIKEIIKYDEQAKIVVCSAMGQQKVVVDAIEFGAKDFIVKPFEESRVLETVKRVLQS